MNEPNAADFVAAQLVAVQIVSDFLDGRPVDLRAVLEDLPIDVALAALAMIAADLLKRHDPEERDAYLAAVRKQFIDGTFLPEGMQ